MSNEQSKRLALREVDRILDRMKSISETLSEFKSTDEIGPKCINLFGYRLAEDADFLRSFRKEYCDA